MEKQTNKSLCIN